MDIADTDLFAIVRRVAGGMQLLDPSGNLKPLDSLQVIDFIMELEKEASIQIPNMRLRAESFASLGAVTELLTSLRDERGS
jgi:hypothetical protein